jgi:3',5'-cyclic AMP phosphodiesterase CpdA
MVCLAHVSDLHATPVLIRHPLDFVGKRFLGWLSWRVRRRRDHRPEVLEALVADLRRQQPDHVVVTGDLTNVACEREFPEARVWLERLGSPQQVSAVPGNHDAYAAIPTERSWGHWGEYLCSDGETDLRFPALRVRGPLALVGVCSANPTPPLLASGTLGGAQLERLEKLLAELSNTSLCRVVLVHHSPIEGAYSPRRALSDRRELRELLARTGADLVLHGHGHRSAFHAIPGPNGNIPVVGTRSASDVGRRPHKRAQYHLYDIEPVAGDSGPRFRVSVRVRGYDPTTGGFAAEGERAL